MDTTVVPIEYSATPIEYNTSEIRNLDLSEISQLGTWLDKYMRLELQNPRLTDSTLLLDVLGRKSREYESDFGVFGVE